jgi:hypothetical protein
MTFEPVGREPQDQMLFADERVKWTALQAERFLTETSF